MPLMTYHLRRKAQPFVLLEELWSILQLGAGEATPIPWLVDSKEMQLTGLVPLGNELEMRDTFHAWAELIGARELMDVVIDDVTHLEAVVDAFGPRRVRVVIIAKVMCEHDHVAFQLP